MHESRLRKRYRAERRFRFYGKAAVASALCFLLFFFAAIVSRALPAFWLYELQLEVDLPSNLQEPKDFSEGQARRLLDLALLEILAETPLAEIPGDGSGRAEKRARRALLTPLAALQMTQQIKQQLEERASSLPARLAFSFALSSASERFLRSRKDDISEENFALSAAQREALLLLEEKGLVEKRFNLVFFTHSDSRIPSAAGIHGALLGSFWALLTAFLLAFPLGLLTAVHLQEFAPRNRLSAVIEVAVYNLAAVPSIVFGLLGLAVFLNWWQLPRSAPLTGGMVLALMTLPTVVVAARSALAAVPEGIRNAGLALGASHTQTVLHHVLPQAMPGILTGTIIGMARALGETAPLLMIGMVAFIAQAPESPLDPATALPVQIFLWADHPDPAFSSRAAAAILVMLLFLIAMNATAVLLRRTFERKRQR